MFEGFRIIGESSGGRVYQRALHAAGGEVDEGDIARKDVVREQFLQVISAPTQVPRVIVYRGCYSSRGLDPLRNDGAIYLA